MKSPTVAMVTIDRSPASLQQPVGAAPPSSRPLVPQPPEKTKTPSDSALPDPNLVNPRLLINGACIYERHLPGDAYITARVQRLQHGYYSSPAVSNQDADHVDFLGVTFVFHSPNTLSHRFKAATIRASVHGSRDPPSSEAAARARNNPRFLMHAPHLLYGAVSPETMQWNYSLSGSLGVADLPLIASLSPSGGINGRYKRYEMMRIQGSVRSRRSPRGREYDVEAGEIVWSLEENTLQRSGLPREFTFAMLIQKPRAESRVHFTLEIEPVLQSWVCSYPGLLLGLPRYKPVRRRPVDFRVQVGQRFEPVTPIRGFNFAALESSFDDYVHMPGRKFSTGISPDGGLFQDDNEIRRDVTRDLTMIDPLGGVAKIPAPANAAWELARRTALDQAAVPSMAGFDPGSFTMRLLLDNDQSTKHTQVASELTTIRETKMEERKSMRQTRRSSRGQSDCSQGQSG
ncbi:uncharacterized protein BO95DRAFT_373806 [Aspergillus brunneoviolaceus CBS 621.78]|uniref:Uncharacterized protein n=1 Tax=Aspergillus brunneoviolaceus CBS 621.78 TaxID=1450534 RepID=A0ACD1FW12_9EURO|nr:hypothetical protein BO95DRAFT_373806 [Aspergillus brunneoviolaceus CBS 621.78]RAH41167.1 hypothetical protein BO95DRAFT_373806 [Aspergillus brunneoviolaceus CBS 621.78]